MSLHNGETRQSSGALTADQDLFGGLLKVQLWGRLGWLEVKRRYRRTLIGPFWTSLSLAMYVASVGIVGAGLWHQDVRDYLPFLVTGLTAWFLITATINEGCLIFIGGSAQMRNVAFEYSILAYALLWRNSITFLHNLVVYAVVVGALRPELLSGTCLLAVPGLLLVLVNGAWIALLCGIICLRFRDVAQLITVLTQISMLITPIFWPPESLSGGHVFWFVEMNPVYHLIDVVRGPLLGRVPSISSYAAVMIMAAGGWCMTYALFRHFRRRIAYWT